MKTSKPISTISFNTPQYLRLKLDELLKCGKISFWAFIQHLPEDDEGNKRDHFHVYLVPSKMLQTDDLKASLMEYDPSNPSKPRTCLMFQTSKFGDWYMYGLHDKRYLASKGESRKYHYHAEDVKSSDEDELNFQVKTINLLSLSPYTDMIEAMNQGLDWHQYFARGTVPLPQITLFERAWYLLLEDQLIRGDHQPHAIEPDPINIDSDTGEVLEPPTMPQKLATSDFDDMGWVDMTPDDELPY